MIGLHDIRFGARCMIAACTAVAIVISAMLLISPDMTNLFIVVVHDELPLESLLSSGNLTLYPELTLTSNVPEMSVTSSSEILTATGTMTSSLLPATSSAFPTPTTGFVTVTITSTVRPTVTSTSTKTATITSGPKTGSAASTTVTAGVGGASALLHVRDFWRDLTDEMDEIKKHPAVFVSLRVIRSNEANHAIPERINAVANKIQRHLPSDAYVIFLALCPVALLMSYLPFFAPHNPKLAWYTRYTRIHKNCMQFLHLFLLLVILAVGIYAITALKESLDYSEQIAKSNNLVFTRNALPIHCMLGAVATVGFGTIVLIVLITTKKVCLDDREGPMSHVDPANRPQYRWQLGLSIRNTVKQVWNFGMKTRRNWWKLRARTRQGMHHGAATLAATEVGSEAVAPSNASTGRSETAAAGRSGARVQVPSDFHPNPAFRRLGLTSLPASIELPNEFELTDLTPVSHGPPDSAMPYERTNRGSDDANSGSWTNTFPPPVVDVVPRGVGSRYTSAPPAMQTEPNHWPRPESPF